LDHFSYQNGSLFAEQVECKDIAESFNTPTYVYSRATIERHWQAFDDAAGTHPHLICYAVKANSNLAVLNVMARLGSGFDIVSGGELARVLEAGGEPTKIVFSGVGKTEAEIEYALEIGIKCFNVESEAELYRINSVAQELNKIAPISFRVNPNVDAGTHPYISTGLKENKFGINIEDAVELFKWANQQEHLNVQGVDCHIGSQLTDLSPFLDALEKVMNLIDQLSAAGVTISHLDLGGGLGVTYKDETPPHPSEYMKVLMEKLKHRPDLTILFEPGRAIMANAGILLTKVEFLKKNEDKNFCIVDAAMNDNIRPALYSAWQNIIPVEKNDGELLNFDVVGPVCETGDFLGKDRGLSVEAGDYLAVRSAGAYGFTMSSNYNSRVRAAEIMIDGDKMHLVRQRETIESLWAGESILKD
jgi:diaminopimelate decarboxylase